ncbi:CKLF-like MARVEL transmembrane domain-containing protein 7 isoform X2 [Vulpes lagopus]|uniref:CKLF-like MARVEL transmembrane domain-containing protein 7 isoform X2 n=1 Tax=Vulpes lagopus TaxID=494514 RepID=UPI001BC962CE|nr:CKLF-like MARVEL transmembrane domain-containing protein 7 isoform X2 [Vulpes lagopus]
MSHGAGLVRTTCSSGGGGGAGQPGARASEGPLDPVYPRTYSALLKVAQMITLLIAFICVNRSVWTSYAYSYFEVVTICNLIMILVFYLVHLFRLYRMLTCISWPLSIFGFVATFLCLASIWMSYKISCVTQSTGEFLCLNTDDLWKFPLLETRRAVSCGVQQQGKEEPCCRGGLEALGPRPKTPSPLLSCFYGPGYPHMSTSDGEAFSIN